MVAGQQLRPWAHGLRTSCGCAAPPGRQGAGVPRDCHIRQNGIGPYGERGWGWISRVEGVGGLSVAGTRRGQCGCGSLSSVGVIINYSDTELTEGSACSFIHNPLFLSTFFVSVFLIGYVLAATILWSAVVPPFSACELFGPVPTLIQSTVSSFVFLFVQAVSVFEV